MKHRWYGLLIVMLLFCWHLVEAESESMLLIPREDPVDDRLGESEFMWIRGKYTNYPGNRWAGPGWGKYWWETDFEDADRNLLRGVRRYTTLDTSSKSFKALSLTDPELFEYPFVYINMKRIPLHSGYGPNFNPQEAAALREYMLRGGFVMLDDFWGPAHWKDFLALLYFPWC